MDDLPSILAPLGEASSSRGAASGGYSDARDGSCCVAAAAGCEAGAAAAAGSADAGAPARLCPRPRRSSHRTARLMTPLQSGPTGTKGIINIRIINHGIGILANGK